MMTTLEPSSGQSEPTYEEELVEGITILTLYIVDAYRTKTKLDKQIEDLEKKNAELFQMYARVSNLLIQVKDKAAVSRSILKNWKGRVPKDPQVTLLSELIQSIDDAKLL